MSEQSPTLSLPYLQPAQAQKHVTHNEALRILDAVTQLSVLSATLSDPPVAPNPGDRYIVGPSATGDWTGQENAVTVFVDSAWQFFAPANGWRADVEGQDAMLRFNGTGWASVGPGVLQNVSEVGVNATADAVNRVSVSAEATLLNHDGAGHQLKINKAAATDTASLLYQTGFSGRAEMGTAGSDDFAIKVSNDGSAFSTAFEAEPENGFVTLTKRHFAGHISANQTGVANTTSTKILYNAASQNDGGMLDTATGVLTPPAGAISAIAGTYATNLTAGAICTLAVWKNGALLTQKIYYAASGGDIGMDVALHDICDGTDSYEIRIFVNTAGTATLNSNAANTYFRGFHH